MAHNDCVICLDAFASSNLSIGAATPCGHCFHRSCFQKWATTSTHRSLLNTDGIEIRPKCPTCNARVDQFVDIYLNFANVGSTNSTTVDVIDIDNRGGVAVADQNVVDEQINTSKQVLKKYAKEMMNLRTQVNSLKDELEHSESEVATLEGKQGLLMGNLEVTIKENRRKERSISELQSRVKVTDIKTAKATRQLHELSSLYKSNLQTAKINSSKSHHPFYQRILS